MATKGKKSAEKENPMRDIRIEKLVLNISVGESGDKLTKGIIFTHTQLARFLKISPAKNQSHPELDIQLGVSASKGIKKLQLMLQSEETKLMKS